MPYAPFVTDESQLAVKISSVFTLIPGVEGLDGPTASRKLLEYSAINDSADKFMPGRPDYGEISFNLFWDPADTVHQYLLSSFGTPGKQEDFQITFSDAGAAVAAFTASVKDWKWSLKKGELAQVGVTLKLSGEVTVTP